MADLLSAIKEPKKVKRKRPARLIARRPRRPFVLSSLKYLSREGIVRNKRTTMAATVATEANPESTSINQKAMSEALARIVEVGIEVGQ